MKCRLAYNGCSMFLARTKDYHQQVVICPGGSPKPGLTLCARTAYISNDDGADVQMV